MSETEPFFDDEEDDAFLPGDIQPPTVGRGRPAALDVTDSDDEELRKLLGLSLGKTEKAEKPKFYCAGSRRTDEETGKKVCDHKAPRRWKPPCPKCGHYFSVLPFRRKGSAPTDTTLSLATMSAHKAMVYYPTGIPELDRVLGGGVVYEKFVMFGAPPGSGKTTLCLQIADGFAKDGRKAYFASGEMTGHSNIDYAKRLGIVNENVHLFCDEKGVDVEELFDNVLRTKVRLVLIDSLQLCTVSDVKADIGTPTMVDAVVNLISSFVQKKRRSVIAISHVNKAGDYAGTEKGKHLVDALIRIDPRRVYDANGRLLQETDGLREIYMEGKSRQGPSNIRSLVELTAEGIRPPSIAALRALSRLQIASG